MEHKPFDEEGVIETSTVEGTTADNELSSSNESQYRASLERLSIDILACLLSYLPLRDITAVSLVSHRLLKACRTNALWKLKFEDRWNIDAIFRVAVSGQNWYRAYQEAYHNPHDLWIFHWNITFPQDGLAPGRCCIYDSPPTTTTSKQCAIGENSHDLCPRCRFFPAHPLNHTLTLQGMLEKPSNNPLSPTEAIAQATDHSIRDFCRHYGVSGKNNYNLSSYSTSRAKEAFLEAATFHRKLNTQQYTAATPRHESETTTCLAQLKDLLFFNVTEEPICTQEGRHELQHLREERNCQQKWEQTSPFSREQRQIPPQEFLKPAYETAHHTWHHAVITNPETVRPMVFRIFVQRSDCFVVFPSEGFLEAGQSKVITFGVRPLGSLVATAFETINAQRNDVEDWMKQVYDEEGTLPTQPFVIRYKYTPCIPCIPARGFLSPHQPQPRQEASDDSTSTIDTDKNAPNSFRSVADVCWENKQMIDYHWSGGDPTNFTIETHELRCIYLSAHVNAHYPFAKFRHKTLTPFDLSVDPSNTVHPNTSSNLPMLYFAAPQLCEFYPKSIYPLLQQVQLETEVSHAGQVFRSHRHKCLRCNRFSWGPRLEEIGQAFVLAKLEDWAWQQRQTTFLQNGITIVRTLYTDYKNFQQRQQEEPKQMFAIADQDELQEIDDAGQASDQDDGGYNQEALIRTQQSLYVVQRMVIRYRSAPYVSKQLRTSLTRLEILADLLGINVQRIRQLKSTEFAAIEWRKSGSYRYATCTLSVFDPQQILTIHHPQRNELFKDEPMDMNPFRCLLHTPGRYDLGPQEDSNHPGELIPRQDGFFYHGRQEASASDMFRDDPVQSLRCAIITLRDPRSVLATGIYDRVSYPGKVVRRPFVPYWCRTRIVNSENDMKNVFYHLQDALDLHYLAQPPGLSACGSFSLRRFLRNIPCLGMARYPVCIDDGFVTGAKDLVQKKQGTSDNQTIDKLKMAGDKENDVGAEDIQWSSCFRVVPLPLPELPYSSPGAAQPLEACSGTGSLSYTLQLEIARTVNQRREEQVVPVGGIGNPNNLFAVGAGNIPGGPPLFRGPGPRLLNLLWAISAQLGWAVDDGSQAATSVFVKRELLIALQWLSLTLMAAPLFWTLVARAVHWIPTKPVEYLLEDIPYQLTSEMRFFSERECGAVALTLVMVWLFLGRWAERWTGRDFNRAMLEHVLMEPDHTATFIERLQMRYKRRWDELCPLFLQRLSYAPSWNTRSFTSLMRHICSWRSEDCREHRSVFQATAGRGIMFWAKRWDNIVVEDESSRKLLFAAIAALGSFGSSTPHFWMNVLTVFSCSISLGMSMSLYSLENGVTGGASGSVGGILKSLNLVTLVSLVILLGQLLGSSGGVLFLAEFVVTSISFILGGAGTISASSVESWGCFFCLSSTAFWGYLFGRVALMDGIIRQKGFVRSSLFSTTLLCVSLAAVVFIWVWIFLWRWDVPASLMILRTGIGLAKTSRAGDASAASDAVARSAAAEYAAKNLQ